jgi:molecular chaperone DnaK
MSAPFKIRKTVGIDLGTTNSAIAVLDPTDTILIAGEDEQGRRTFPSVIAYHPEERRFLVGPSASARKASAHPADAEAPVASVKRFMGLERFFEVGPESLTPPEISARILTLLREMLDRTVNEPRCRYDAAVITMPAYFNHNQIEATRQAADLAGFEVSELLHEPTAAAIYYSWMANHGDATYLVYDLGGGTFDVSVIRKRLGDYEVLSVSGDPFLGGDDFDRLLASYLQKQVIATHPLGTALFEGDHAAVNFYRLVHAAERFKVELTTQERVQRYVPDLLLDAEGNGVSLEAFVDRVKFESLIKDKVDRTIGCCHEALRLAKEKAGVRLADIDYIVLVGGSSRIPLVRETVKAAFGNPELAEHVRNLEPLLDEPDLCVAYGAALRGATHGVRYADLPGGLELHVTSPPNARDTAYTLTGAVRVSPVEGKPSTNESLEGGSVQVRSFASGLTEEAFLDDRGRFAQELELEAETDNFYELALCDPSGEEVTRVPFTVRHVAAGRQLGQAVLPTQLITKPLQIEVLNRQRQRVKQVIAPVGATLPGTFSCTFWTTDQGGRIVVPIFEENRIVKQMVLEDLDPNLPVGSPVEVEFTVDVRHHITVRVVVQQAGRCETATLESAPPSARPTRAEIDEIQEKIDELLPELSGGFRARIKARVAQLVQDLKEALRYEDEPKAIQRMAELRDVLQQLETGKGADLEPPWPKFAELVRQCRELAARLAEVTRQDEEELFSPIEDQENYAEQAYEEHNQELYSECLERLSRYGRHLDQMLRDALPESGRRPAPRPRRPEEEAKEEQERFRARLSAVWKKVRSRNRADLDKRLADVAKQGQGLSQRARTDVPGMLLQVRRLLTEIDKVEDQLEGRRPRQSDSPDAGLLEGMV